MYDQGLQETIVQGIEPPVNDRVGSLYQIDMMRIVSLRNKIYCIKGPFNSEWAQFASNGPPQLIQTDNRGLAQGIHDGLCLSDDPWALEKWPMPTAAEAKGLLGLTP